MNKYGEVAVRAIHSILNGEETHPLSAWKKAASISFGEGTWGQRKGCPKNAFLGLCEKGLVNGIPHGNYSARSGSEKNKYYAIHAIEVLKSKPGLSKDKLGLWREVLNGKQMSHNSQMDVVLALWNNHMIDRSK
ncbi:DUF6979 family protein [Paenibacillus xylanilyticus]|uniref:DUF6979 family protein n=1 Tax=Paenibacillus xylanilyticus TaxID=248903 RepID=UPI0039A288AA